MLTSYKKKQVETVKTLHDMQGVAGSSPAASTKFRFNNLPREPEKPFLIKLSGFFMS